jgi:hypothetical protein
MPRYDEMDDLLSRVRERLVGEVDPTETPAVASRPAYDTLQQDRQYEAVLACTQALLRDAESLHELLGSENVHILSAAQQEHVLSVLNSVMQEFWSSEVTLRRAGLHE